jgi:hypothetical protein
VKYCKNCQRESKILRRGLCSACYQRFWRGSVAVGASCVVCGLDDGRLIRAVRLATGEQIAACHNHGWLAERTRPQPSTVDELKALFVDPNDRRQTDRRELNRRKPQDRRLEDCRRLDDRSGIETRRESEDRRISLT